MILLRVVPHEGATFDHLPQGATIVVGRSPDCDLVIADPYLSRHHARLVCHDGDWFIEDLGSYNGTRVNGERIFGAHPLKPRDVVTLSGTSLEVQDRIDYDELCDEPSTLHDTAEVHQEPDSTSDGARFRSAREMLDSSPDPPIDDSMDEAVRLWSERLRVVNEIHKDLARSLDLTDVLARLLDRVFDHLEPERGVVYLARREGGFYVAAQRSVGSVSEPLDSTHLVQEVAEKGLAALVLDVQSDERFSQAESLRALGIRSLVAAPLLEGETPLGMIALDSTLGRREFQEEDLDLLVAVASAAALRIRNLSLIEAAVERNRLELELALARRIQVALLPREMPTIEGWEIHGGNLPSRGVSGDMYEVVERCDPEGGRELVLLLVDVSGKGMAASLLTASLEALLAPLIEKGEKSPDVCRLASRLLHQRTSPEKYATAVLAALDPQTGDLEITVAGHPPAFLIRAAGEVERLGSTGPPLGLLPDVEFRSRSKRLDPGDTLLLYTDGLVEACDPEGEEYGLERLAAACSQHRNAAPEPLAQVLEEELKTFVRGIPFTDDRTLLIVQRRKADPAETPARS